MPKQPCVRIVEVGVREGVQIEGAHLPTSDKIRLANALACCRPTEVQATAFVDARRVPAMADADQVVAGLTPVPGTSFTALWLNDRGLERALVHAPLLSVRGEFQFSASDAFSRRNLGRSTEEWLVSLPARLTTLDRLGLQFESVSVMAAFGCNYEGEVAAAKVLALLARVIETAAQFGQRPSRIQLADTMGWGNPESVARLVAEVRGRWPDVDVNLHLHDTRGMGLANAYGALAEGVREFDAAVGGLGGCPFAGFKGAAGNIATEDLVHMLEELGYPTGVDLDALIEVARLASDMFGRDLPGKVHKGGRLRTPHFA